MTNLEKKGEFAFKLPVCCRNSVDALEVVVGY